jgi:F-box protein 25/32
MPFIGKDWRAPGETWVRLSHTSGWEQIKLRPIQISACSESPSSLGVDDYLKRHESSASLSSTDDSVSATNCVMRSDSDDSVYDDDEPMSQPHCFVKTSRSKEFIGCTSMSEAFHRLDLARAVRDVRRFNYVCKVVEILVHEKGLLNLSATARKHLFAIIQSIVIHSVENDVHVSTARDLVSQFGNGLEGHVCGSPQLVSKQMDSVSYLVDMICDRKPTTLTDSSEESLTFLDLPREVISQILSRLSDHISLLEIAKASEALQALIEREERLWDRLCKFHFTQEQITKHKTPQMSPRQVFFQLKKYYGLREIYADLIHICCHCKVLFWKDHGHPCVSKEAPSVRVTPKQFVDMLLFL